MIVLNYCGMSSDMFVVNHRCLLVMLTKFNFVNVGFSGFVKTKMPSILYGSPQETKSGKFVIQITFRCK